MDASITVRLIDETQRGFSQINNNLSAIGRNASTLTSSFRTLTNVANTFIGVLGAREVLNFINSIQSLDNRLRVVTGSTAELEKAYQGLFNIAQKTRQPLETTVTIYSRMQQSAEQLGLSQKDVLQLVENFNKALAIGGATTAEARSAMIQFTQALNSGKAQMQDLNPLLDSAPELMRQIYTALGVTAGEFRKFTAEGKITSKMLSDALLVATENLAIKFQKSEVTVGQAITQLSNSFDRLIRDLLSTTGASNGLVSVIQLVERNLEGLITVLKYVAGAFAIAAIIRTVTLALGAYTAAVAAATAGTGALSTAVTFLSKTPLGRIISLLGLAAGALVLFKDDANAAEKETGKFSNTTEDLNDVQDESLKQYKQLQESLRKQISEVKGGTDAYKDFIKQLEQEVEVSKLDNREKTIAQTVYRALAAEAKKFGGDLSKISATRRAEIESEVRALANQVEDEKAKTEQRKKVQDDLRRKQEEYDRFIKDSRTINMTDFEKFLDKLKEMETDYENGALRDLKQFEDAKAALQEQYQKKYRNMLDDFYESTLDDTSKFQREAMEITAAYQAGLITSEKEYHMLLKSIRAKYGKEYDDMAKKQREEEMTAVEKHQTEIQELERAWRAGLIKNQQDYDAIRRKIDKDYIESTVSEYSNLYGLLNEKLLEWSGLTQKEYGIVRDVIKLTFGVDVEDLIKQFFAASIRYLLGFRTAAENDMGYVGTVITKLFGKGGTAVEQVGIFNSEGTGILDGFGTGVGSIFAGIGSIISKVFSGGLDIIGSFVKGAFDLLGGFGRGAGDLIGSIFDGIGSIFTGGGGGFSDIPIIGDILDFGGSVVSGIGDIFGGGDILGSIGSAITDIPIIGDIASGIGSLFTGGGGAAAGGAGAFLSGAASFLAPIGLIAGLDSIFDMGIFGDSKAEKAVKQRSAAIQQQQTALSGAMGSATDVRKQLRDQGYVFSQLPRLPDGSPLPGGKTLWQLKKGNETSNRLMDIAGVKGLYPGLNLGDAVTLYLASGQTQFGAKGGMVTGTSVFKTASGFGVIGEAGAEAILPIGRMSDGSLGVKASSGPVNVNFTINAVDAEGVDQLLIQRQKLITNMVRQAVQEKGKIGRYI